MEDESGHKNPWDAIEERFLRLEEKFIDISHNMALLMECKKNILDLSRVLVDLT
jgi:hypothetical protein